MRIILHSFEEFEVLAAAQDGKEAVAFCEEQMVDIALLDIQMPVMNGVDATRLISERTNTKCLILTTFDDEAFILDAIKHGAKGYLLKNNDPERIRQAIISVHNGNNVLQDAVLDKLKSGLIAGKDKKEDRGGKIDRGLFTDREFEIMSHIARGLSNREISKELFISEGTVANHITSILGKTGLTHRTQIAIYFLTGEVNDAAK